MRLFSALFVIALLLVPAVSAKQGTIKLLALVENEENSTGTLADLSLETGPGMGRVFLDTFPLTKIATQVSLRFAQQVACSELDKDCSGTDFFFAIRASPGIVGGPSAGAAAAVLAAAMVDGRTLDPGVAITGTINSGGLIGPVGGLKYKLEAAAKGGLRTVLIPSGTSNVNEENVTVDLIKLGETMNLSVIEVATLDQALVYFTGSAIHRDVPEFVIDPAYASRMKQVAQDLCGRTPTLGGDDEDITNLSYTADTYFAAGEYYAAASYCFRANLAARRDALLEDEPGFDEFQDRIASTLLEVLRLDGETSRRNLTTVTDLQTFMLVKERLQEAAESLNRLALVEEVSAGALSELAYAEERAYSATTWSGFFGLDGAHVTIDNETLQRSCLSKLGEAEERYNYVQSFFPGSLKDTRKKLDRAQRDARNGLFVTCLHQAAQSKAEADIVLSVTGVDESRVQDIIGVKLDATARSLARAQSKDIFPLIGYSYYEYAKALRTEDEYSSLLFAEYANEMSGLDIYFPKQKKRFAIPEIPASIVAAFVLGMLLGAAIISLGRRRSSKRR
ncbi:hypothetical protein HY493_03155 [Candidatus Woesearchaeota archaeon]|nr:hypothetical protein [Candidatus Woesearchaeota archaeon]